MSKRTALRVMAVVVPICAIGVLIGRGPLIAGIYAAWALAMVAVVAVQRP